MKIKLILFFVAVFVLSNIVSAMEEEEHAGFANLVDINFSSFFANPIEDILIYPAHYAARLGNLNNLRRFLNRGNILSRNKQGQTVLHSISHRVIHDGRQGETKLTDVAAYILGLASDFPDFINTVDESKKTALHHSIERERFSLVSFLLKQPNIRVELQDRGGNNVAHLSAKLSQQHLDQKNPRFKALRYLYRKYRFLFSIKNDEGKTPLDLMDIHAGIFLDDPVVIDHNVKSILLENSDGETPLHTAAKYEQLKSLNRIIMWLRFLSGEEELSRLLNMVDNYGNTALLLAAKHFHSAGATMLLANGANPNIANKEGHDANYYLNLFRQAMAKRARKSDSSTRNLKASSTP